MFITSVTVITAITVITKRKEKSVLFGCGFDFNRTVSGEGGGGIARAASASAGETRQSARPFF